MPRKTTKTVKAVKATTKTIPVFYALGKSLIEARVEAPESLPAPGATITLKERSLHTRGSEHCTRPCCAVEATRQYTVQAVMTVKAQDALSRIVTARAWDEKSCRRHEWCSLFDTYTLAGYLGRTAEDFTAPIAEAAIIDVKVTA